MGLLNVGGAFWFGSGEFEVYVEGKGSPIDASRSDAADGRGLKGSSGLC